ncbi:MAG: hypothetical protein K0S39_6004 [Paenibacillus sp.]|jgi:ribosomal protein S15P/S13E|nr:hypothetical protein [Paenibacillus sp.]
MTPFERFTAEEIDVLRNKIEKVTDFAVLHKKDHTELMGIIDNLARIASMFADVKAQELKGKVDIVDPQGYIESKLDAVDQIMRTYTDHNRP